MLSGTEAKIDGVPQVIRESRRQLRKFVAVVYNAPLKCAIELKGLSDGVLFHVADGAFSLKGEVSGGNLC